MTAANRLIRCFEPSDALACSEIVTDCLTADPSIPPALKAELLRLESDTAMCVRARLFYIAVYLEHGRPLGLGGLEMNEIRMMFVDPDHQFRGIGSALLNHLEELVPPALFSNVFVYAAPGAVPFYRAHGYEPGGEHVFDFGSHRLPTIFMTKRLTPGLPAL
jgi:GNAT superfamily N-acetyltransferase